MLPKKYVGQFSKERLLEEFKSRSVYKCQYLRNALCLCVWSVWVSQPTKFFTSRCLLAPRGIGTLEKPKKWSNYYNDWTYHLEGECAGHYTTRSSSHTELQKKRNDKHFRLLQWLKQKQDIHRKIHLHLMQVEYSNHLETIHRTAS